MLPAWLDADAAAPADAEPAGSTVAGALPGLAQARELTPLQRLQRVQESGLAESSGAGEPVYLAWRRFLRGRGGSVLVIDATDLDVRARGTAMVLDGAPRLLAEGVLIAAGLRDSRTVELRLPAELGGHEAAFLNAVDALRALAHVSTPRMQLEVRRDSRPAPWAEGHALDGSRLTHTPADLVPDRPAVRRRVRPGRIAADAPARRQPARCRRARSLGEPAPAARGLGRRHRGEERGPGARLRRRPGRLLPLSAADVSCEPLALASAGVIPAPSTLMVIAEGVCLLRQTRRALYRHWRLAAGDDASSVRPLLARAARLVTEITLARGDAAHLAALDEVALELAAQGLGAAWPLGSSLRYFRDQWERHARRESCPEGLCLERPAAPCHRTCPANIDIPSFIAHLGHGDYRAAIEVIRRDNPLPLTCGLVCPAHANRSACAAAATAPSSSGR